MNKREQKKEHILQHGLAVMKRSGYNGTSVKDIVDAAGVPKGSFYNYFDSKEGFAIDALDYEFSQNFKESQRQLLNPTKPPLERLHIFFSNMADALSEAGFEAGCFVGTLCQEMSDTNPTIRTKVRRLLSKNAGLVSEVLLEAQNNGDIDAALPVPALAEFVFNAWEGALMKSKASKCREPLDAFLTTLPILVK